MAGTVTPGNFPVRRRSAPSAPLGPLVIRGTRVMVRTLAADGVGFSRRPDTRECLVPITLPLITACWPADRPRPEPSIEVRI